MCPITVIIYVSFEDILVLFSSQRLNCILDHYICAWFGLVRFVDVFLKNALMCILKKVKLINNDCLPILMLLYIVLYIMLAYLMLLYLMLFVCCLLFYLHIREYVIFIVT